MKPRSRRVQAGLAALLLGAGATGAALLAQIEGVDRGVAPVDSTSNFEVAGVVVDVAGKSAEQARLRGWREAQRLGWRKLWERTHGGSAPGLSDGALDSIVSAIVVEDEQIGPNRYIARLGVLFDRVRTAEILGVAGSISRSAPLLLIPVQWSGGFASSFEGRSEWQKAWARYRTDSSAIDYVRVAGTGADPLLLNEGQTTRPGRKWWRALLDQYGAADVLVAQVRLERSYPGGPVTGFFSARYGPDNRQLKNFVLRVPTSAGIPKLMDEGVKRIDEIYATALAEGILKPDRSLIIEQPVDEEEIEKGAETETTKSETKAESNDNQPSTSTEPGDDTPAQALTTITIQFDSPDAATVGRVEGAVRGVSGVKSASTSSLAIGGVSIMRVSYAGDGDALRAALASRGLRVSGGGANLKISAPGSRSGEQQKPEE